MGSIELPSEIKSVKIYSDDVELGLLTHSSNYNYQPVQLDHFVSLTMTLPNMQGYSHGVLHPIFSQNLPEGHNRQYIASKLARYAKVNDMYLLALQENNGIGMLSYRSQLQLPELEVLSLNDILNYDGQSPLFPQLLEKYYLRNSLAGVQPKVSIPNTLLTDRTIPQKDLIVKSYDEDFDLLTVNEYVCMQAAQKCGLEPPNHYLSNNLETYIVERFDRASDGTKLGYEDFTTLTKKKNDPDEKYKGSYENLLKATALYTNYDSAEIEKMYSYIVFNCLIGNGDAHLKNFALQYKPDMGKVYVSPPFDITHTLIYPNIDNNLALKINGSKQFPNKTELLKLSVSTDFKIRNAKDIIESYSDQIMDYLKSSNEVQLLDGLRKSIEANISRTMTVNSIKAAYKHDRKKKFD